MGSNLEIPPAGSEQNWGAFRGWLNKLWTAVTQSIGSNAAVYNNVTSSRVAGTTYTNTAGKILFVSVNGSATSTVLSATVSSTGVAVGVGGVTFAVPVGATYSVAVSGGTILSWFELF